MEVKEWMLSLIHSEFTGELLSDRYRKEFESKRETLLPALYQLSKHHDIAALVGGALHLNGLSSSEAFHRAGVLAVFRAEQQAYELSEIRRVLKEAKIKYLLLKGSVLRPHYPDPAFRTSSDIDILLEGIGDFEAAQAVCALLVKELGYTMESGFCYHHIGVFTQSGVHIEVHFDLIEDSEFFTNPWVHALPVSEYEYHLDGEYFFAYHMAHMAKHFMHGGCGVRPFIDLYVMKERMGIEFDHAMCDEAGVGVFSRAALRLLEVWFYGGEKDELLCEIENYVLMGGVYGTVDQQVAVVRTKKGKFSYLWSRLFLSRRGLSSVFPFLVKAPGIVFVLCYLPLSGWRILRALFDGRGKKAIRELKASARVREGSNVGELCSKLGLKE